MRLLPPKSFTAVAKCSRQCVPPRAATANAAAVAEDAFIAQSLALAPQAASEATALNAEAAAALASARMPSTRVESFRYTDIAPVLRSHLSLAPQASTSAVAASTERCTLAAADSSRVVIVDGAFNAELSSLSGLPASVYVGPLGGSPNGAASKLGAQSRSRGGVFATLNSAAAASAVAVIVPSGEHLEVPIHVVYVSSGSADAAAVCSSAPRLLVDVAEGAQVEVIEEFVALDAASGRYLVNAVLEADLAEGAVFRHAYVEGDADGAFHMKCSLVAQARGSRYSLVEARMGGSLTRHDVDVQQDGEQTSTEMKHFVLCSAAQLHDLHTTLVLNHPEGTAAQLHKCIVADAAARGVFDGNVQVLRAAQKSDASQLSRNLLLVPKATVNVKPNLQIIADDVKCTHGCAVSDLAPEELFYFLSRGIDAETARKALVFSFGSEVVQQLRHRELVERLQGVVNDKLVSVTQ